MESALKFRAPWSKLLIWVSTITTLLCLTLGFLLHKQMFPFAPAGVVSILLLLFTALPLLAFPFFIRGYTLQGSKLLIHRLGWNTTLDISEVEKACFDPNITHGSIRLFGNGGLFSFTGWFSSHTLGTYRAFFTDPKRTVVLIFPKRKIVISPENPDQFVELLSGNSNARMNRHRNEEAGS